MTPHSLSKACTSEFVIHFSDLSSTYLRSSVQAMTIYSLYIFDRCAYVSNLFHSNMLRNQRRHCACIYYQDWHRTKRPKAARDGNILPFVSRSILSSQPPESQSTFVSPRNTLASDLGVVIAVNDMSTTRSTTPVPPTTQPSGSGLPFDEEAKLVYGVILSLRNMVKKLSRRYALVSLCTRTKY
jgi:hypothetical protein